MRKLLICLMLVVSINLVCGLISPVFAEPTPPHRKLLWDANDWTIDPDLAGYWLYYAAKSEPEPRVYNNLRRIQLTNPNVNEVFMIDVKPDASSGLCFKVTAYDTSGNESDWSNEACGWFGMKARTNLTGAP